MTRARLIVLCGVLGMACSFVEFAEPDRQRAADEPGASVLEAGSSSSGGSSEAGTPGASEAGAGAGSAECEPEQPRFEPRCEATTQSVEGCGFVLGPQPPSCVCGHTFVPDRVALVDDFDDGDTCLRHVGQYMGFWFGARADCLFAPEVFCDAERRSRVVAVRGDQPAGAWSIAVWLNSASYCPEGEFDASAYQGLRFSAKADASTILNLTLRDRHSQKHYGSTPEDERGSALATEICVGPVWQELEVPFSAFARNDPDAFPEPLDASSLKIIEWGAGQASHYELYVDDVEFY
jgi:hypothetical protein